MPMPPVSPRSATVIDRVWQLAYHCAFPVVRRWWRIRQAHHRGALVAIHGADGLLLLRMSYRRPWGLPGGGIKQGETPEQAARRELREELRLDAPELVLACCLTGTWDGRPEEVYFFEWRDAALPALHLDLQEIVAARWAGPGDLAALDLTGPVAEYVRRWTAPP